MGAFILYKFPRNYRPSDSYLANHPLDCDVYDEDTLESDIDLLVSFEDVSSYSQKKNRVTLLKDILEKSLGRQIDILEISNNIDHNTYYAIKTAIKIY